MNWLKGRGVFSAPVQAILLGLLSFAFAPLVAATILSPFLLSILDAKNFNVIVVIAKIFGFRDLGGFFASEVALILLLILTANLLAALVSWRLLRSKKLAALTFIAALVMHLGAALTFSLWITGDSKTRALESIAKEERYKEYGSIGNISVELKEPYFHSMSGEGQERLLSGYRKLIFFADVIVRVPGKYEVHVKLDTGHGTYSNFNKNELELPAGLSTVDLELEINDVYAADYTVDGVRQSKAQLSLFYLESLQKIDSEYRPQNRFEAAMYRQFLKDEGLDKGIDPEKRVAKPVADKAIILESLSIRTPGGVVSENKKGDQIAEGCIRANFPIVFEFQTSHSIGNQVRERMESYILSAEGHRQYRKWNFDDPDGMKFPALSCANFIEKYKDQFELDSEEWSWHSGSSEGSLFLRNCRAFYLVAHAEPAQISCLSDFRLTPDHVNELPSTLGLVLSTWAQRGMSDSLSLPTYSPSMKFSTIDDEDERYAHVLLGQAEDQSVLVKVLAYADFNHDGYQDVLLSTNNSGGNSYSELTMAVMSRRDSKGILYHVYSGVPSEEEDEDVGFWEK